MTKTPFNDLLAARLLRFKQKDLNKFDDIRDRLLGVGWSREELEPLPEAILAVKAYRRQIRSDRARKAALAYHARKRAQTEEPINKVELPL